MRIERSLPSGGIPLVLMLRSVLEALLCRHKAPFDQRSSYAIPNPSALAGPLGPHQAPSTAIRPGWLAGWLRCIAMECPPATATASCPPAAKGWLASFALLLQEVLVEVNVIVVVEYTLKPTPEVPVPVLVKAEVEVKLFIRVQVDTLPWWNGEAGRGQCAPSAPLGPGFRTSQRAAAVLLPNLAISALHWPAAPLTALPALSKRWQPEDSV
jgi:hypothetical protein